ncbi:4552_t:CDS:1 [Ambispora leptoticha]|uniref:DNA-binding protein RAP1 n=1 Tax=Ambispora leptoticha TaxID=144679 RepID=A0A9N9H663_9GLOM|nr:4552_t:CDS:1 [Ambispora leptoticha]
MKELPYIKPSGGPKKDRSPFNTQETAELKAYLLQKKQEGEALCGNAIYKNYPGLINGRHTWQSIRSYALKFILPYFPKELPNLRKRNTSQSQSDANTLLLPIPDDSRQRRTSPPQSDDNILVHLIPDDLRQRSTSPSQSDDNTLVHPITDDERGDNEITSITPTRRGNSSYSSTPISIKCTPETGISRFQMQRLSTPMRKSPPQRHPEFADLEGVIYRPDKENHNARTRLMTVAEFRNEIKYIANQFQVTPREVILLAHKTTCNFPAIVEYFKNDQKIPTQMKEHFWSEDEDLKLLTTNDPNIMLEIRTKHGTSLFWKRVEYLNEFS